MMNLEQAPEAEIREAIDGICEELLLPRLDPIRSNFALTSLSRLCLLPDHIEYIINSSGLIPKMLSLAENFCPNRLGIRALICLDNLALFPETHKILLENGALEIALRNLRFLQSGCTDEEMDSGLRWV